MTYKDEITRQLQQFNNYNVNYQSATLRKIDEALCWAWENWGEDILSTYYEFEKPEYPTDSFIENWVDNTDFEADGYDIDELKEEFEEN